MQKLVTKEQEIKKLLEQVKFNPLFCEDGYYKTNSPRLQIRIKGERVINILIKK